MKNSTIVVGLTLVWSSVASAGYLMVDNKPVQVPFHVVHTYFDFDELVREAAEDAKALGESSDDDDEIETSPEEERVHCGLAAKIPKHTKRYVRPRKNGPINSVDLIVLHSTMTYKAQTTINALVARGLSTHLIVDWDGTVYQLADLGMAAFHAGIVNKRSIGIDLVNPSVNEAQKDAKRTYDPKRESRLVAEGHKRSTVTGKIQGRDIRTTGYTKAQVNSTYALVAALVRIFPNVPPSVPRGPDKKVLTVAVKDPAKVKGVVAHWHTSERRWDPGPGLDFDALEKAIKKAASAR